MKLGQTSIVYFLSRILASLVGFLATLYFARLLGAGPLGIYYLVLGIVSALAIFGKIGISGAISKRVSEGKQREEFAAAGGTLIAALFAILALGLLVFRPYVDAYVGYPATGFILLLLFLTLGNGVVSSLLTGLHLVHFDGVLSTVRTGSRSLLQIGAVVIGLQLTGLFLGYAAGYVIFISIGGLLVARQLQNITLPEKHHFKSLFDYAKFSWLGSLQSRLFNYTDIIVLGFFVPSALIGIYGIAWNIAQFFIIFSGAISTTLFPEMSELSTTHDEQAITNLVEDALSYAGLLLIPGLLGAVIVGERLLRLYGEEFTRGVAVLGILIVANLIMSYQNQVLNTLNAVDRPDLSFRVNALFILANLSLNVGLVYLYGWIGAAVATALSVAISLLLAYHMLKDLIDVTIPYVEIGRQWLSALVMSGVVIAAHWLENTYRLLGHNAATVVILVSLGAVVYFATYYVMSRHFRTTVSRNLPFELPFGTS